MLIDGLSRRLCAGRFGRAQATRANATGRDPRWTLGRVTSAAAPLSGRDWRRSVPPCNSTSELAMARPSPDPFMPLAMTARGLLERPAQPHEVFRGDAGAVVLDGEMDELGAHSGADRDFAAFGREFHRVAHERREDALDRQGIGLDRHLGARHRP